MAEAGSNSAQLVGRHRRPDAAPAEQHAPLHRPARHRLTDPPCEVRVVYRRGAVGPEVLHLVPVPGERGAQALLQLEPGVIGRNRNTHGAVPSVSAWGPAAPGTVCRKGSARPFSVH